MEQAQRNEIEQRLLNERNRVIRSMQRRDENATADDGDITNYPLHLADEGTDATRKEQELLLLSVEGRLLYEIDGALRRMYREPEQFDSCESCGRRIDFERLMILPWARRCVACQSFEEGTQARQ